MKITTVETSQLSGAALDWAVAKAVGLSVAEDCGHFVAEEGTIYLGRVGRAYSPSTNWSQGGPLIQEEQVEICWQGIDGKAAFWIARHQDAHYNQSGDSPLIASCRAIVAAELGDDVDVPAELMEANNA